MDDPVLLGRYEILEEIGRGGMGRVVKARDVRLRRLVAIKFVLADTDSSFVERLAREAQATAKLKHPNIVDIYDVGEADGSAFIVMEYLEGKTLEAEMRSVPQQDWGGFVPALAKCADALDYAHREGIVHRDIKPSNIMITSQAVPKIMDFGIAHLAEGREARLTITGAFIGTPLYMAPEQILGMNIRSQTDQYALAVIMYTLLTGRHPFLGPNVVRLIREITEEQPPVPSDLNPLLTRGVDQALLKGLAKNPEDRFISCQHLFEALEKGATEFVIPTRSETNSWALMTNSLALKKHEEVPPADSAQPAPLLASRSAELVHPIAGPITGSYVTQSFEPDKSVSVPPQRALPAPTSAGVPSREPGWFLRMLRTGRDQFIKMFRSPPVCEESGEYTPTLQANEGSIPPAQPLPAPPPTPPTEPGEFTQMLQASKDRLQASKYRSIPPGPPLPAPSPTLPKDHPGDFTQMFQLADQSLMLRKAPEDRIDADKIARAQSRELIEILDRRDFESAVALRGKWLPGIEGAPGELIPFTEASRYLGAAQDAVSPHVRIEHLRRPEKVLLSVGNQLLPGETPLSRHLPQALEAGSSTRANC